MYRIERISKSHDKTSFDCGVDALNTFLQRYARQNDRKGLSRTYVLLEDGSDTVVGFYTLSAGSISFSSIPDTVKLPRYPIPTVHLGRLATSLSVRGRGLGELLLIDAMQRAVAASHSVGVFAIDVIAKSKEARRFYEDRSFIPLVDEPLHLFLPIATAEAALEQADG